jgi:hypothetical protein
MSPSSWKSAVPRCGSPAFSSFLVMCASRALQLSLCPPEVRRWIHVRASTQCIRWTSAERWGTTSGAHRQTMYPVRAVCLCVPIVGVEPRTKRDPETDRPLLVSDDRTRRTPSRGRLRAGPQRPDAARADAASRGVTYRLRPINIRSGYSIVARCSTATSRLKGVSSSGQRGPTGASHGVHREIYDVEFTPRQFGEVTCNTRCSSSRRSREASARSMRDDGPDGQWLTRIANGTCALSRARRRN